MPTAAALPDSPLAPIASNAPVTMTNGERIAEVVTGRVGSWPFILVQAAFLLMWFVYGGVPFVVHDPFPWLGANILMSAEAAFSTSFILIASNVASRRDRAQAARIEHLVAHSESLEEQIAATEQNMVTQLQALSDQISNLQGQTFVLPPSALAPQTTTVPYVSLQPTTNATSSVNPSSFMVKFG